MAASSPSKFEQQAAAIFFLFHSVDFRTCDGCGKSYNSSYIRTHQRKHCSALKKSSTEAPASFPSEEGNLSFAGSSDQPILDSSALVTPVSPDDFPPISGPRQAFGVWQSPPSAVVRGPKFSYGASPLQSGVDRSGTA